MCCFRVCCYSLGEPLRCTPMHWFPVSAILATVPVSLLIIGAVRASGHTFEPAFYAILTLVGAVGVEMAVCGFVWTSFMYQFVAYDLALLFWQLTHSPKRVLLVCAGIWVFTTFLSYHLYRWFHPEREPGGPEVGPRGGSDVRIAHGYEPVLEPSPPQAMPV